MKKACMFTTAVIFCAVLSFAQNNGINKVYLADKAMPNYNNFAAQMDSIVQNWDGKDVDKLNDKITRNTNEFKAYKTAAQTNVNAKIQKAYEAFISKKEEHKKEYYKTAVNQLVELAGADILKGDIYFLDGDTHVSILQNYEVYDYYGGKNHKTDKVKNAVILLMIIKNGPNISVSFIRPLTFSALEDVYFHKWKFEDNKVVSENLFPRGTPKKYIDDLKNAGAPIVHPSVMLK